MSETRTTCPYCGVGCGVVARTSGATVTIEGDRTHPANFGKLCVKGANLAATIDDSARLTTPLIDGAPATWDTALDLVADRFRQTIAEHGPDSVAFYVSGQFLTEDYYVANKLMKGFIGSGNIDTNSRLCMASSVAGHVRAFGEDVVPCTYEDLEQADLIVLVGSNTAWCHPVLFQRLAAARGKRNTQLVVIDPRRTATAEDADLHLPLAAGTDVLLFNGLLTHLATTGALDRGWTGKFATGLEAALSAARRDAPGIAAVAAGCGLDPNDVARFYDLFASTDRTVTVYSQGVNQSSAGTDKVNAIINCHLATGRIGRPGTGPFSFTGQPNAMGGREVGGLANQLAAHMRFDNPDDLDRVTRFWHAPSLATSPGLKAVDLFEAVHDGRIKALWIACTNPAASMPRAGRVREALDACPFVVVSDCWHTDTTRHADVILPAESWGEKDGTVTNSERRITRQRRFRAAPGEARADWWMFADVARRMGWSEDFAWKNAAAVFREHAALSTFENDGARLFDLGALTDLDDAAYDDLRPVQWPAAKGKPAGGRLFAQGGFSTPDRRAHFVPTPYLGAPTRQGFDFLLNTARLRDQWHTMTRTGIAPMLMEHTPEPLLAVSPADAARRGLTDGGFARVETEYGSTMLRVDIRAGQRDGEIHVPMHWTDDFSSAGPIDALVTNRTDPHSGQPELKATPARLEKVTPAFFGILLRRGGGALPRVCNWNRIPIEQGQLYKLAATTGFPGEEDLAAFATALLAPPEGAELLEMHDARRQVLRVAVLLEGRLEALLFLAETEAALPDATSLAAQLGTRIADADRPSLLAAKPRASEDDDGRRICSCYRVGEKRIRAAIAAQNLTSVASIGAALRAGTNCGSCIPELQEILRDVQLQTA